MSVCVIYDPWARMGNRMFQYAFGSLLAARKGVDLFSDGLPNFNINSNLSDIPAKYIETKSYGSNFVDIDELTNTSNNVVVNSFVQKSRYYKENRAALRECFNIKEKSNINRDILVLHVRETDYKDIGCFLGYHAYKRIIYESKFNNVSIVTDNSSCETVQRLVSDGCNLITSGYVNVFSTTTNDRGMSDFYTLLQSENIAISQSSFSWWAGFLGYHKNVIFPYLKSGGGMWKELPGKDDIDLFYTDKSTQKIII